MKRFVIFFFLLVLASCATQKVDSFELQQANEKIKEMIEDKDVEIFVTAASPLANQDIARIGLLPAGSTANRILLNGDEYFKLKGNQLSVHLPFYGTQQLPAEYLQGLGGFQFDGVYDSYEYEYDYDDKKKVHTLKFKTRDQRESLTIYVKIFRTRQANIYINSSHRTAINYDGRLKME